MRKPFLVIVNCEEKAFWSNDMGWIYNLNDATHYPVDNFPDGLAMVAVEKCALLKIEENDMTFYVPEASQT